MSENKGRTGQNKKADLEDIVLRPGPRVSHGAYTYLRVGRMPKKRANVERYLTWVRQTYIEDIAGAEEHLTAGQAVLLNKVVLLEGMCRCIEITAGEIAEKTKSLPVMPDKYLAYVNSIVKICHLLGIERRRMPDQVPTPLEIAEEFDRKKDAKERESSPGTPESDSKARDGRKQ